MDNMEIIDSYFEGDKTEEQKQQFEERIMDDASFAEEVAFYISAKSALKIDVEEKKNKRFRELYNGQKVVPLTGQPIKMLWRYVAAASIVAAVMIMFLINRDVSPRELADNYIDQKWQTIGVKMGPSQDSLQRAVALYDAGELAEAFKKFEGVLKNEPSSQTAKKGAGMASLRLGNYDKAVQYFTILASETLRINPGKFYQAITLMKRNEKGDAAAAKELLQEVIARHLYGSNEAAKWLEELDE